ncbi:MAG: hypothetical protein IJK08_05795 [Prevotella sp.]|nr:hypothetical protein [Prevotella sp.]
MEKDENIIEQIIETWTQNYPPADENTMYTLSLSSYEIAEILGDFVEVSPGDVTRVLLTKGYQLTRNSDGGLKWLIKRETTK